MQRKYALCARLINLGLSKATKSTKLKKPVCTSKPSVWLFDSQEKSALYKSTLAEAEDENKEQGAIAVKASNPKPLDKSHCPI